MGQPVTHFEIAARDLDRAAQFYEDLFGWTVQEERTEGYRLVETAEGSIGGGLLKTPEDVFPYVTIYVEVADLLESLKKAEELGGKVVVEPMPIPGVGSFAMFLDPDGVVMGLIEERASMTN
jgi:hypothetical protein